MYNICINPYQLQPTSREKKFYFYNKDKISKFPRRYQFCVDCGRCELCQKKWRNSWTLRTYLQFQDTKNAVLLSLSYSNLHLPHPLEFKDRTHEKMIKANETCKLHWQSYIEAVRKRLKRKFGKSFKISYMAVNEQGTKRTKRMHIHALIFGVKYSSEIKDIFFQCWKYGDPIAQDIRPANAGASNYVTKYALKGQKRGQKKFFFLKSNRGGGIGLNFLRKNKDYFKRVNFKIRNVYKGFVVELPYRLKKYILTRRELRIYKQKMLKKCEEYHVEKMKKLKLSRAEYSTYFAEKVKQIHFNLLRKQEIYNERKNIRRFGQFNYQS